ncbi:RidA family protein [uncultured Pseudoteredinibacter sp.]|uniref:RidA family protein n=1 Tax=uncultured Pseudoteredinibacter sp. TaxID=1641701 RepID=UPI002626B11F|nr:RidA family protein [uncultured Pseudoteredinibacter sp.]
MEFLQPENWVKPKGYANGVAAQGRMVFTGGLIGWDENENFPSDNFAEQVHQTFKNIVAVLAEADAKPSDITRLTWYITDKQAYLSSLKEIGAAYRDCFGRHFPAMAVVQVAALMEDEAMVEIEATAVVED